MLKLVSNKNGNEVHYVEINQNEFQFMTQSGDVIQPDEMEITFDGIATVVSKYTGNKKQLILALMQLNSEYVWAVVSENPQLKPLTRRQFRLALVKNNFNLADIEELIEDIEDEDQRQIIRIEWQDSTVLERQNPSIGVMSSLLKLSSERVDELWKEALTI